MSQANTTSKPETAEGTVDVPKRAKLFKNGRSQAVRLPKEFRFEGTEVEVRRDDATGDVVLSATRSQPTKTWDQWFNLFDSLDIPKDLFEREVHEATERDIF
jgi:antitoxin VapB